MKRVEMEADQMPGQDSFLDVITNIVGILILLVLVVGLRTSRAVHECPDLQRAEQARTQGQLRRRIAVRFARSGTSEIWSIVSEAPTMKPTSAKRNEYG